MMLKATKVMRTAMSALAVSVGVAALPVAAFAQQAAPAQGGAGAGGPPLGWFKTCTKQDDADLCVVQNIILA
ncbi:MAG: invasion associated locus B family protein, partial [Rhizobiaceae bacterium]